MATTQGLLKQIFGTKRSVFYGGELCGDKSEIPDRILCQNWGKLMSQGPELCDYRFIQQMIKVSLGAAAELEKKISVLK
jgi:hypothetical protein